MEEASDKNAILKHFSELVEDCDLKPIFLQLSHKDNSFKKIVDSTKFENDHQHNNRCLLFELMESNSHIMHRKFIYTLRKNGYDDVANKLENKPVVRKLHKTCCFKLPDPEFVHHLPVNSYLADAEPLQVRVTYSKQFCDIDSSGRVECYRTRSKNRGQVLIINNIKFEDSVSHPERKGAEVDEKNLREMLCKMGFSVESHRNLTKSQMQDRIWKFTCNMDTKNPDICFVIVMSHGEIINNKTNIMGSDSEGLEEEWVIAQFNNNTCLLFKNKPKILIFHVCRGDLVDSLLFLKQSTESDSACSRGPELESNNEDQRYFTDMIICYPSVEGFKAHRDQIRGSWYIELICQVFMEKAHEMDVESMLKLVDKHLGNRISEKLARQTSTYKVVAFKTCYLNPGIYEEGGEIVRFEQSV